MSLVYFNMKQLESHWRSIDQKNEKESTTKKRARDDDNVRTVKNKTEMVPSIVLPQNRKIVKIIRQ
jgi:hypothetical protein